MQPEKRKLGVIYDTSYLVHNGPSVKAFILSRKFSGLEKPGLLGSLASMFSKHAKGADRTIVHPADSLFDIYQVIPEEVIDEVQHLLNHSDSDGAAVSSLIKSLMKEEAACVQLGMDSVVGDVARHAHANDEFAEEQARLREKEIDEQLLGYATRLVTFGTRERYDLCIIASNDSSLLTQIAERAGSGKALLGISSDQLTHSRILHDKLSELASFNCPHKVTMEN